MDCPYPIEQLARSSRTRFQLGFARMTIPLLPRLDDVAFEPSSQGLKILAASELALAMPGEIIRQLHADQVEMGAPRVRLLYGDTVREPIMWVRVSVREADAEAVVQDLVKRGAAIEEVDWRHPRTVIRALASLRNLLGYPDVLAALVPDDPELRMWPSHYQTLPPGPEDGAA